MAPAVVEAKRIRGFSRSFRMHFHEEYSIALVLNGRIRSETPAGGSSEGPGRLVLIPEGIPHACNPEVPGAWSYILLLVRPGWMRENFEEPVLRRFLYSGALRAVPASPDAFEVLDEAARASRLPDGEARREAEDRLKDLILSSADAPGGSSQAETGRDPDGRTGEPRARRMEALLREKRCRRVALRDLAATAGVCEREALRIFRSAYGLPPYAYLTNLRVNAARRLLRRGLAPSRVAQAAGFYDQSHLTRVFARHVGLTPAEYAESVRKDVRIVQDGRPGIR